MIAVHVIFIVHIICTTSTISTKVRHTPGLWIFVNFLTQLHLGITASNIKHSKSIHNMKMSEHDINPCFMTPSIATTFVTCPQNACIQSKVVHAHTTVAIKKYLANLLPLPFTHLYS